MYKITVEWGFESGADQHFKQREYNCEKYSLSKYSTTLHMYNVQVETGFWFNEVVLPLREVTMYYVGEGTNEKEPLPPRYARGVAAGGTV